MSNYWLLALSYSAHIFFPRVRNALVDPLVRSRVIEIGDILTDEPIQLSLAHDQHVIQAFASHTANEPLTDGIGFWSSHRCPTQSPPAAHTKAGPAGGGRGGG